MGYHIFHFKHIHPQNEKQKKRSFILMRTQIGFNLKCIAQCICSKSSRLTFLDNDGMMSDTLLTIIPKDFYKDQCVIGYGYEVGKLRFKHIRPRLFLATPPLEEVGVGGGLKQGAKLSY